MILSEYQQEFTHATALLILYAEQLGYRLTYGDAYRDPRCPYGHAKSLHRSRLAVDFNIFRDGVLLYDEHARRAHNQLHDFWDKIGGAPRINDDLNHYSFAYNGMR